MHWLTGFALRRHKQSNLDFGTERGNRIIIKNQSTDCFSSGRMEWPISNPNGFNGIFQSPQFPANAFKNKGFLKNCWWVGKQREIICACPRVFRYLQATSFMSVAKKFFTFSAKGISLGNENKHMCDKSQVSTAIFKILYVSIKEILSGIRPGKKYQTFWRKYLYSITQLVALLPSILDRANAVFIVKTVEFVQNVH